MLARLLLFVKHRIPWVWALVEWLNAVLFRLFKSSRMISEADQVLRQYSLEGFVFRFLEGSDLETLSQLIRRQGEDRLRYFQPHGFDVDSLEAMKANPAFLMFGAFKDDCLVGYFFLRCFWNGKCFVGRLIDKPYERMGIGRVMNHIMYYTAWRSGFRCMTTISKANHMVMRSHKNNPHAKFLGELGRGYIWVEFVEEAVQDGGRPFEGS